MKQVLETEWLDFKINNVAQNKIGEYLSALSNSAVLAVKVKGYSSPTAPMRHRPG